MDLSSICWLLLASAAALFAYFTIVVPYTQLQHLLHLGFPSAGPYRPVVGHLYDLCIAYFRGRFVEFGFDHYKQTPHKMFACVVGVQSAIGCIDPEYIAVAFSAKHAADWNKGATTEAILQPIIGRNGLFLAAPAVHARHRKMIAPAFHHASLVAMQPTIAAQIERALDSAMAERQPLAESAEIELHEWFRSLTFDIIAACAFSNAFDHVTDSKRIIHDAITALLSAAMTRFLCGIDRLPLLQHLPIIYKSDIERGTQQLRAVFAQILAQRKSGVSQSGSGGRDLLQQLIDARDEDGVGFHDEQIRDEIMTFIFAGHDTTSSLMTWLMYVLMQHEQVYAECRDEVDRVCGENVPTHAQLSQLVIVDAVLHETLRLYPPACFAPRGAIRDIKLEAADRPDLTIPKGTTFTVDIFALHRSASYWERPEVFEYGRWVKGHPNYSKPTHPAAYAPFSIGPRNCLGSNFALLEAKLMIATILLRWDFRLAPKQNQPILDFKVTLVPRDGLRAIVTPRKR